jgi:glutaredoxin-like protein NrdH
MRRMPSPVKLYTLSTCGHCTAAKRLLDDCSVAYEFTDVDLLTDKDRTAILDIVKKFNPRYTFPTIIIGDTVIIGFREHEIREALNIHGY